MNIDAEHFRARVLQDCLTEATAAGWIRRAEAFEAAAPRPGDFNGRATVQDLAQAAARCRDTALACRRHAQLIRDGQPADIEPDILVALQEVA